MYKIYFYSEPNFLFMDSDSVKNLDLKSINQKNIFEIIFEDYFFENNFRKIKSTDWLLTIQSYNDDGSFVLQSNIAGSNPKIRKIKKGTYLRLEYDQITNNEIWPSLPPIFETSEQKYKMIKLTHQRNAKLRNILD